MKYYAPWLLLSLLLPVLVVPSACYGQTSKVTADEALKILKDGNMRFAGGEATWPNQDSLRRKAVQSQGQRPLATVLGCSDSRVAPELLFDVGIGDIFVVRVAGNVAGIFEAASVEYGVTTLGTPLLIVLGHTRCGTVGEVCRNDEVHGNMLALVENIRAAVIRAGTDHPELSGNDLVEEAIRANVRQSIQDLLRMSEPVRKMSKAGTLKIIGAVYDTESGRVQWMETVPH